MILQWVSLGAVLLTQLIGFVALLSRMNYMISEMKIEVEALRKWRHDAASKLAAYDIACDMIGRHDDKINNLIQRVAVIESRQRPVKGVT